MRIIRILPITALKWTSPSYYTYLLTLSGLSYSARSTSDIFIAWLRGELLDAGSFFPLPPPLYPFSAMESIFLLKRVVSHASHTHTRAFSTNFGQRWKSRLVQTLVFPLFFNFFFFLWTWVSKGWKDGDMIKRLPSISKRRGVALSRLIRIPRQNSNRRSPI